MKQKGFTPIIILLIFVGIGLLAYFRLFYEPSTQPSPQSTSQETGYATPKVEFTTKPDSKSSIYPNYKHHVNEEAHFTFDYPDSLSKMEIDNPYEPQNVQEGIILLCEGEFVTNHEQGSPHCANNAGIRVWYNPDGGWLSPCPDNKGVVNILGKQKSACVYDTGVSVYLASGDNNQNSFLINILYSASLTKSESEKILSTFKFIQ